MQMLSDILRKDNTYSLRALWIIRSQHTDGEMKFEIERLPCPSHVTYEDAFLFEFGWSLELKSSIFEEYPINVEWLSEETATLIQGRSI